MEKLGHLAMVDAESGDLRPLFWNADMQDDFFLNLVKAFEKILDGKKV